MGVVEAREVCDGAIVVVAAEFGVVAAVSARIAVERLDIPVIESVAQ